MSKNSYHTVVFGSGLPALLLAYASAKSGFKTLLVSRTETRSGHFIPIQSGTLLLQRDFGYWPASDVFSSTLDWIQDLVETNLKSDSPARPPVTFQKGGFHSFVGFGDKAPASVDCLRSILDYENSDLAHPLSVLASKILSSEIFDTKSNFSVEQFEFQNQKIVSATNFEGVSIRADRWLIAENLKSYFHLLPSDQYSARDQARLHKTKLWTAVSIDMLHAKTISSERGAHVLMGTTDDAIPCVGGFETPAANGTQASHWISYVDPDSDDEEATAHALREMKRQLKRAYPEAAEKPLFERISVELDAGGVWACKTDASSRWQGLENVWLVDSDQQPYQGLFGQLRQAHLISTSAFAKSDELSNPDRPLEANP